ncbi:MAG: hypothetical protein ACE5O2_17760, partial [Armatimonadota bacterium]
MHALFCEPIGSLEGEGEGLLPGDDGHVAALALHVRDADGNQFLLVRDVALVLVVRLVLKEQDRVVVADGRFQQPSGVPRRT